MKQNLEIVYGTVGAEQTKLIRSKIGGDKCNNCRLSNQT